MSKDKPTKAIRLHNNVITSVRTAKRTYNVTVSKTQIRVAHVVKTGKGKSRRSHTRYWTMTWDEFDAMFDKGYAREAEKDG